MAKTKAMAPQPISPLKDEHYYLLKEISKSCANTREFLQKCKDSYIDVDREWQLNEEQDKVCSSILRNHFPNKP